MKNHIRLAALAVFVFSAALHAEVKLTWGDETFTYPNSIRLSDALTPLSLPSDTYWPSAALFKPDEEVKQTKQTLLENLNIISKRFSSSDAKLQSSIEQLIQIVTSWKVAKRSPIEIDFDLARIQPSKNPLLAKGNYVLTATQRSKTLFIFGAVAQATVVKHLPHSDVSDYLTNAVRIGKSDPDYVYILQADGRVIYAPSSYWNQHHQEVMPGSMLFVPFKESLFHPEFEKINDLLVSLAKNRVL
tara:strand:- start:2875 stop:3609 length:735 start_codon:yes stop_codon:yes gene_type:complete